MIYDSTVEYDEWIGSKFVSTILTTFSCFSSSLATAVIDLVCTYHLTMACYKLEGKCLGTIAVRHRERDGYASGIPGDSP